MRRTGFLTLLALGTSALAEAKGYQMTSMLQRSGKAQPLFAWCDAQGAVYALIPFDVRRPLGRRAKLYQWPKGGGLARVDTVTMSEGDGAAGSVYYPFGLGKSAASHPRNYVRISNVENTLDPSYRMTRVGEVMLNNVTYRCRYVPEAAFVGVTPQRTVIVWEGAGGEASYATRNFNGRPGVSVRGLKVVGGYRFTTSDGYSYAIVGKAGQKRVEVRQGAKLLSSEHFRVYSESLPK